MSSILIQNILIISICVFTYRLMLYSKLTQQQVQACKQDYIKTEKSLIKSQQFESFFHNRNFLNKYNSPETLYYGQIVTSLIERGYKQDENVRQLGSKHAKTKLKDLQFDSVKEHMKKLYSNMESVNYIKKLTEYYRFYDQLPNLFNKKHFKLYMHYVDQKNKINYQNLKQYLALKQSFQDSDIDMTDDILNQPVAFEKILQDISSFRRDSHKTTESQSIQALKSQLQQKYGAQHSNNLFLIDNQYTFENKNKDNRKFSDSKLNLQFRKSNQPSQYSLIYPCAILQDKLKQNLARNPKIKTEQGEYNSSSQKEKIKQIFKMKVKNIKSSYQLPKIAIRLKEQEKSVAPAKKMDNKFLSIYREDAIESFKYDSKCQNRRSQQKEPRRSKQRENRRSQLREDLSIKKKMLHIPRELSKSCGKNTHENQDMNCRVQNRYLNKIKKQVEYITEELKRKDIAIALQYLKSSMKQNQKDGNNKKVKNCRLKTYAEQQKQKIKKAQVKMNKWSAHQHPSDIHMQKQRQLISKLKCKKQKIL